MKRAKDLYQKLISDENLRLAILTVNATHKWHPHHRPNKTVLRVEADIDGYVEKLREIIVNGYDAAPPRIARRWDKSAGKWRDISEPRLWPDQYVHHAVIQVLEPVLMRGMDKFCCGSIKGRGIHYGVKAIKKWMRTDPKGTKYAEELDIHHFYDSLTIETVMARLRRLVKDRRTLDVCERLMKYGVLIGAFFSQWFMIRRKHPKGTDFEKVSARQIAETEQWINNYPRKILGYISSEVAFRACLREIGLSA